jgi:hypothetical protein
LVGTTDIDDDAVTLAKMAHGTANQNISYDGSGVPVDVALSAGKVLQVVNTTTSASATGTADFGNDDTIPQNSEGTEFMTLAITPAATSNKLIIITNVQYTNSASARTYFALFQDSTANALGGAIINNSGNDIFQNMAFQHYMTAGTTSSTTFKIRGGTSSGTLRVNGNSGGRFWGGILSTSMTIVEID